MSNISFRFPKISFLNILAFSIFAGAIAIAVNTFILFAADWIPLATAHGGLLKLIVPYVKVPLHELGVIYIWQTLGLPSLHSTIFRDKVKSGVCDAFGIG